MNRLYSVLGTSRQAFHNMVNRSLRQQDEYAQLSFIMDEFRKDHPGMSLRDAYLVLQPRCMGRDKFEVYFKDMGYGVRKQRNFTRTTDSSGVIRFPNLLESLSLTRVNQVWVSDITYYQLESSVYYLTFIMDLYSRRILGYQASTSLHTENTTIPALERAFDQRKTCKIPGLIIHSDGGGQYYSKAFRKLTQAAGMKNSMGKSVYENPHAERVNGIIKNNYLKHYDPKSFNDLRRKLEKAVRMYNEQKPHKALSKLSPCQFESILNQKDVDSENNSLSYFPLPTSINTINLNLKSNSQKTVNVI